MSTEAMQRASAGVTTCNHRRSNQLWLYSDALVAVLATQGQQTRTRTLTYNNLRGEQTLGTELGKEPNDQERGKVLLGICGRSVYHSFQE
jgi:hypothetical protein